MKREFFWNISLFIVDRNFIVYCMELESFDPFLSCVAHKTETNFKMFENFAWRLFVQFFVNAFVNLLL